MQRLDNKFDARFIDYATVVIGLYYAAAGFPLNECLKIQNIYAAIFSNFGRVQMDRTYTHLAERNVFNTKLGYELFNSGRIGPVDQTQPPKGDFPPITSTLRLA